MFELRKPLYRVLCVLPAIGLLAAAAFAVQERGGKAAAQSESLTVEQREALNEAGRLEKEALKSREKQANSPEERIKDCDEAIRLSERALEIKEKALGSDSPAVAETLSNLAKSLYLCKQDYGRAEALYQRALSIRERSFGPIHPAVAGTLFSMAEMFFLMGDNDKAEKFYKRLVDTEEKIHGAEHIHIATALDKLAKLYERKRDYALAEPLYLKALNIAEKTIGPDDIHTAGILKSLGDVYLFGNDHDKAERYYMRAFAVMEKKLEPDNFKLFSMFRMIAQNNFPSFGIDVQERFYLKVLAAIEKKAGADSTKLLDALYSLGQIYRQKSDHDSAAKVFERIISIEEISKDRNYHQIPFSLLELGSVYFDKGDREKAEQLFQKATVAAERDFGSKDLDLANYLIRLGDIYFHKVDPEKAYGFYQRALEIAKKNVEEPRQEHYLLQSLFNVGHGYSQKGEFGKAEEFLLGVLAIEEKNPNNNVSFTLSGLAAHYDRKGDHVKAEQFRQRSLAARERELKPDDPYLADSIRSAAYGYLDKGEIEKALPFFERILSIKEKALGPESSELVEILTKLGEIYFKKSDREKADALLQRALRINEKSLGAGTAEFARSLYYDFASLYERSGDEEKAEELRQRALTVIEKALGPDPLEFVGLISNVALGYKHRGDFAKAELLYQKALSIKEKALGPYHPDVAELLNYLASLYQEKGDYKKAEQIFLQLLKINEKRLNSISLSDGEASREELREYVSRVNNLALLYRRYDNKDKNDNKAEELYRAALAVIEKRDPDSYVHFNIVLDLANMASERKDFEEEERLLLTALAISERKYSEGNSRLVDILNRLSYFYEVRQDRQKSEQFFERAFAVMEKNFLLEPLGQTPPYNSSTRQIKGIVFSLSISGYKDDANKTEQLYQRTLTLFEKKLGPDHPEVAELLIQMTPFYQLKNEPDKAEKYYQRALAITEKAFGPDSMQLNSLLKALAANALAVNNYDKAEALLQRALAIMEKGLGSENSAIAHTLFSLASLYDAKGDSDKAEKFLDRTFSMLEKSSNQDDIFIYSAYFTNQDPSQLLSDKESLVSSEKFRQRALTVFEKRSRSNPDQTADFLYSMASFHLMRSEITSAVALQSRSNEARERDLTRNLVTGSERQKLLYLNLSSKECDFTISLNIQSAPDNLEARRSAMEIVLRRKGRALDAMTDGIELLRRIAGDEDKRLLDELSQSRAQLSAASLVGSNNQNSEAERSKKMAAEERVDELEAKISARGAEFRALLQPVTLDAVQKAMPQDAALIEFAVYRPNIPPIKEIMKAVGEGDEAKEKIKNIMKPAHLRYAAYLIGSAGEPLSADLGDAETIDKAVADLRSSLRDRNSDIERDIKPKARALYDLVMKPVLKLAGNTRRLLISPDGSLNLIPFDALIDEEGRYLVQQYEISYLTSGRDLFRLQARVESKQKPLIIADPDFAAGAGPKIKDQAFEPLKRLTSTAEEAAQIKEQFGDAVTLLQAKATKRALKEAVRPRILHIATHGFFLEDEEKEKRELEQQRIAIRKKAGGQLNTDSTTEVETENPLLRSGLFLAGANAKGEDSVLTALEAAGLDLSGTKLVVLSACDTGVGDVKNGDGVYGLRRALVLAGSESQLMSLWPVSDEGTKDLMVRYYERLKAGEGRSAGLRKTRLEMLSDLRRRHPYYWASFIQSGEWANLEGKR